MNNKLINNMTPEEIMTELNLVKREGHNKAMLSKLGKKEDTRTITIEKYGCVATIETSVNDDVIVDVYEETDAEFGRRVRFSFKVEEYRKNAPAKREAYDKQVGRKANKRLNKFIGSIIDVLGK